MAAVERSVQTNINLRVAVSSHGEASSSSDLEEVPLLWGNKIIVDHADINVLVNWCR